MNKNEILFNHRDKRHIPFYLSLNANCKYFSVAHSHSTFLVSTLILFFKINKILLVKGGVLKTGEYPQNKSSNFHNNTVTLCILFNLKKKKKTYSTYCTYSILFQPRNNKQINKLNDKRSSEFSHSNENIVLAFVCKPWLNLWKAVMMRLHTTDQSMNAILLDKWNESLLILSDRRNWSCYIYSCVMSQSCTTSIYWDINEIMEGNKAQLIKKVTVVL